MKDKIGRRKFFAISGGLTALATMDLTIPAEAATTEPIAAAKNESISRYMLCLDHRASRSGPVATLADGTLLWVTTEPEAPYLAKAMWSISRLVMRRSTDGGKSWGDPQLLAQGTKEYSLLSHTLRRTKSNTLVHIFTRYSGYDYETGTPAKSLNPVFFTRSTDNGRTWSEAVKMPTGERYQGDNLSMEQLRDGRLIYPFCFLTDVKSQFAVSVMYSDDDGKKWMRSESVLLAGGGGFESGASEPTVVELTGGKLWMLIRAQTGFLWESFSTDRGKTWSPAQTSALPSSNAPATALRLANGDIAVVWNNHVDSNYARQSLVIGLTRDGKTLKGVREVDFVDFADNPSESAQAVSYAYLTESKTGDVIVSYNKGNWGRYNKQMVAAVSPAWITARSETFDLTDGRTGWHTINPGPLLSGATERYVSPDDKSLWLEIEQNPKYKQPTGIVRNLPMVTDGEIRFTVHAARPDAYLILSDSLPAPGKIDDAVIRIRFKKDNVYLAAGNAERLQNDRKTTQYSFLSHKVTDEVPYPGGLKADSAMDISIKFQAAAGKAEISINGGPAVVLQTAPVIGITFAALIVADGGLFRVQKITTNLK